MLPLPPAHMHVRGYMKKGTIKKKREQIFDYANT